jgi:hypothetical protein
MSPQRFMTLKLRPWQRHSTVLFVAGVVYVLIGAAYALTKPTAAALAAQILVHDVPRPAIGAMFVVAGLCALASTRWPPAMKTWGYTVLATVSCAWASVFLMGVVLLEAPLSGITGALVWYLMAFLWWGISGLVNPDDVKVG